MSCLCRIKLVDGGAVSVTTPNDYESKCDDAADLNIGEDVSEYSRKC